MDAYIKKIYDMLYSPIVSPYNLLDNAKLENYNYVKYYKNNLGLVAEMQCMVPDNGEVIFYYQFDHKDHLQKIYQDIDGKKEMVFDRISAIEEAKQDYYSNQCGLDKVI